MDLLATRYANPYFLLEEMISAGRLEEFVHEVNEIKNEERLWEVWLHRVFDKPYNEWKESLTPDTGELDKFDAELTVRNSFDILEGFIPE